MRTHVKRLTKTRAALLAALLLPCGVAPAGAAQKRPRARAAGGVSLVLAVKADAQDVASSVARTAAVIRKRCAGLRVRCELRPGDRPNRLLLRFSPAADAERVTGVLLSKGFELRAVASPPNPAPLRTYASRGEAEAAAGGGDVFYLLALPKQEYLVAERPAIVTGDDLRDCAVVRLSPNPRNPSGFYLGGYDVDCQLRPAGAARLKTWTSTNVNRYLAVVLHGLAVDAPYVKAPIWLNVAVHAGPRRREAEEIALILSSGNLPAPVELLERGEHER